jgi:hypothetical protein
MKNQNDQKIPPLLPLEYCTTERAARLLGCEEEDIYHWRKIGAIKVYAHLDKQVMGNVSIFTSEIENHEFEIASNYLSGIEKRIKNYWDHDMKVSSGLRHKVLKQMYRATLVGKLDEHFPEGEEDCLKYESIYLMGVTYEYGDAYWEYDNCLSQKQSFSAPAAVFGFWEIDSLHLDNDELIMRSDDEIQTTWGDALRSVQITIDKINWDGQYYLLSEDLLKLHTAIHTGKPLLNRYNDPEIAAKMREQQSQSDEPPKRLRSEQVLLMQELAKRVLGTDTIDMPSKQAEVLLAELSSSVPAEELPSVRSVTRYLGGK